MPRKKKQAKFKDLSKSWDPVSSSGDEAPIEDEPMVIDGSINLERSQAKLATRRAGRQSMQRSHQTPTRVVEAPVEFVMPSPSEEIAPEMSVAPPSKSSRPVARRVAIEDKLHSRNTAAPKRDSPGFLVLWSLLQHVVGYIARVVGGSLFWLQPLFSLLLPMLLLWWGYQYASGTISSTLRQVALQPLCAIPGLSLLPMCSTTTGYANGGHPEFDKLMIAQANFDEVLESSTVYAALPMDLKRTELSVRDLKHIVLYSNLPSRQELSLEFDTFVETARQAGQDLTKFNAAIGRTMDQMLSTNRWTLQVIEGVNQRDSEQGAVARFFGKSIPSALGFVGKDVDEAILEQYLKHANVVEDQITHLVLEAQALLALLGHLDGQLDIIAGVVTRDGVAVEQDRDKLFAMLWTKLGGNRSSVKKLDEQIKLLNGVSRYRRAATDHVSRALLKLQEIQADLVNLKERVALPDTIGLEIPLAQHLDVIRLGVERLEATRKQQRVAGDAKIRQFIGEAQRGGAEGPRVIEGSVILGGRS